MLFYLIVNTTLNCEININGRKSVPTIPSLSKAAHNIYKTILVHIILDISNSLIAF